MLRTKRGPRFSLPLFLPVWEKRTTPISPAEIMAEAGARGFIVNAFYLWRDRAVRQPFLDGLTLRDYLGVDCFTMTDSGAFQGFQQRVILNHKKIVSFQNAIGTDVISPLDLVGTPGEKVSVARSKAEVTLKRIRESMDRATTSTMAGVQQGGRHAELRRWCTEELLKLGIEYLAIGSLVPFFTRKHNIGFAFETIREARAMCGDGMPIHVYGSGDPLEIPFFAAMGANIFDSSSYAHYAIGGWYMTPFGAVQTAEALERSGFDCGCPVCAGRTTAERIAPGERDLMRHNLHVIHRTVEEVGRRAAAGTLDDFLAEILTVHEKVFPEDDLVRSWQAAHGG